MLIKSLEKIPFFTAGDHTILKEVLHPKNDQVELAFSIAFAKVETEKQSLLHQLKHSEVYIFLNGEGIICINQENQAVKKGDVVYVPSMAQQFVKNTGDRDLEFYCIVSPAWQEEDEYVG